MDRKMQPVISIDRVGYGKRIVTLECGCAFVLDSDVDITTPKKMMCSGKCNSTKRREDDCEDNE